MRIPLNSLSKEGYDPKQIRDGIIIASDFAKADPYRASTHNKGIMNGIDAVGKDYIVTNVKIIIMGYIVINVGIVIMAFAMIQ